jgi:chromosome segregation protein
VEAHRLRVVAGQLRADRDRSHRYPGDRGRRGVFRSLRHHRELHVAVRDADAHAGGLRQRLAAAAKEQRRLEQEGAATASRRRELDAARRRDAERLAGAETRLAAVHAQQREQHAPDHAARLPLVAAVEQAQQAATAARVAAAAVTERRRLLAGREAALRAQAAAEAEAAVRRAAARAARLAGASRAEQAARLAGMVLARLDRSLGAAEAERDRLVHQVRRTRAELEDAGRRRREASAALDQHRAASRASDSARVEARVRAEDLATRLVEEFSSDPDEALREYLPDEAELAQLPEGDPRRLPDQELRRIATALDRRLALLGRVNPLALEEFKALEERYAFLSGQLQDLRESRRDLLKLVRAVDERVREVFGQAFVDVAAEFERTFALLFPGGEGRLVLTDPDDLLGSGVEVEARPPGKRVRRLSLLSGGERSLAALAFCFAVFRARPSPFYVLDEVEAALDDVNLQRFLDLLEDAREHAQLLVVSHQRRTMEAADALYGVSMQAEGVSKVVSQRLRDEPRPLRRPARPRVAELEPQAGRSTASAGPGRNGDNPNGRSTADRTSALEV